MQKFSELIKKSTEDGVGKKKPAVQKGRFKIAKSDDDKMLAFGWANVSITADGELIEDYQEDIIEPEELESAAYKFAELYREGGEMHERGSSCLPPVLQVVCLKIYSSFCRFFITSSRDKENLKESK